MPQFSAILDRTYGTAERPKPLPVGSYVCIVQGQPRFDKSSKKQTPFVEFTLKPIQPGEDVDPDALAEVDGIGERTLRATFYLSEDGSQTWRLEKFLANLGIEEESEKSLTQAVAEAPGRQVLVYVKHRASEDGESVFAEVSGTAAVE